MKKFFTILLCFLVLGLITFLIGNQKTVQTQKSKISVSSLQAELIKMKKDIKSLKAEIAKYKECIKITPRNVTINRDSIALNAGKRGSISLNTFAGNLYLGGGARSKIVIRDELEVNGKITIKHQSPVNFTGQVFFKRRAHFMGQVFFDEKPYHRYKK